MKVYLLRCENYEGVDIYGIYSSREKAIESLPFYDTQLGESEIEEMDVDPPHGPRHKRTFYVGMNEDGSDFNSGTEWTIDLEEYSLRFFWANSYKQDGAVVQGHGKTEEEARQRAIAGLSQLHPVYQVGRCANSSSMLELKWPHPSCVFRWELLKKPLPYAVHEDLNTARQILWDYENTGRIQPGLVLPQKS